MKTQKEKTGISTFGMAMLLYFAVGMLAVIVGVRWLSQFVVENEKSQAKYVIEDYIEGFGTEDIRKISADYISGLNHYLESEEESFEVIKGLFDGELSYVKQSSMSTSNDYLYIITVDGAKIGEVHVCTDTDMTKILKMPEWEVRSEQYTIPDMVKSAAVTVPNTWTVFFNGAQLDSNYITETGIQYSQIRDLYSQYDNLPCMVTYSVSNYIGEHEFTFTDSKGNAVELSSDLNAIQEAELNNCTDADRQEITNFCSEFVTRLVDLNSNKGSNYTYNVSCMRELLVPNTEYYNSIGRAGDSMVYTSPKDETIDKLTVNRILCLGENRWSLDLNYILSAGFDTRVTTDNRLKLTLVRSGGSILADGVLIYPAETIS